MSLQPLPQAVITASKLRRQAHELELLADELEASAGVKEYQPKKRVEFAFSKEKLAAEKPTRRKRT